MSIEQWMRSRIAGHLNVKEQDIDSDAPFTRLGIDSVEALLITVDLEDKLGRRLATTLVWDHPTIARLARFLEGAGDAAPALPVAPAAESAAPIDPRLYDISRFDEYQDLRLRLRLAQVPTIGNPYFKLTHGVSGNTVIVNEQEYVNYATYNYLGLSGHPRLIAAAAAASRAFGTSSSASRTTSGDKPIHRALERAIAKLLGVDDAVCYVGGHSTNVSFLGKFVGPADLILHDELAHDSIIQGAKLSGAARVPFRHNSAAALDAFLRDRRARYRRVVIAVEGVYSTDGDIAPLRALVDVKRRHGALLMVDEAHSIGALGVRGGGVREHAELAGADVDIWMGTLSKAFASCGGYIAGSRSLVELVKYTSPGFIYSVGMTPANAAMALEAIQVMIEEPQRVRDLEHRAELFRRECKALGLDTGLSKGSAVVPVLVGDSLQCMRLAQSLFRRHINVTPMVHPAVKNDAARLRFFISALHTEDQLRETARITAAELAEIRKTYAGSFSRIREAAVVEPVQAGIAREGFEAFTKGDLSVLRSQLAEDARYFFPGTSPVAGYRDNRDAILDFFASIFELTDGSLSVDLQSILSDADHGVLLWNNTAHLPGKRLDGMMCEILDITGDKVVAATFYTDDLAALDDFLGGSTAEPAVPGAHMRRGAPADTPFGRVVHALVTGPTQLAGTALVTIPPTVLAAGGARITVPLANLHEQLAPLRAAGHALTVDFAVAQPQVGVARIVVTGPDGLVGTMCLVADYEGDRIARAWIGSDGDLWRGHGKGAAQ